MNKIKEYAVLYITLIGIVSFVACATRLASDGPYQSDTVLYNADKTIINSYDALESFVKWEHEHRRALADVPEVTAAADYIRKNASTWFDSALALRDAYAADPSVENRRSLKGVLDTLQAAMAEAAKYMQPKTQP